MKFSSLTIDGAYIITPEPVSDARGLFARIICQNELKKIRHAEPFVQINHSITRELGSVRGMHYQVSPKAEIKIIKCIRGAVFDVIVDLRKGSPTFLKWCAESLSEDNMKMMYAPKGVAHGFQVLEAPAELIYFHTEFYRPQFEGALRFDDPVLAIKWPLPPTGLSERDQKHPLIDANFEGIEI